MVNSTGQYRFVEGVACGNERHPNGPGHPATPLPASWEWVERFRHWVRIKRWGCGCAQQKGGD